MKACSGGFVIVHFHSAPESSGQGDWWLEFGNFCEGKIAPASDARSHHFQIKSSSENVPHRRARRSRGGECCCRASRSGEELFRATRRRTLANVTLGWLVLLIFLQEGSQTCG